MRDPEQTASPAAPGGKDERRLEDWLRRFRWALASMPLSDRDDIVEETRAHVRERLHEGARLSDVLDALGPPDAYARGFIDEMDLSGALASQRPKAMFGAVLRRAHRSAVAAFAFLVLAARPVARLFVDDAAVVDAAVSFIIVLGAAQPLMAIDFTLSGALRGAGDTRFPLAVALLAFYVFRLGAAWLVTTALHLSLDWLWLALIGDYLVRATLKMYRFRSGVWKLARV